MWYNNLLSVIIIIIITFTIIIIVIIIISMFKYLLTTLWVPLTPNPNTEIIQGKENAQWPVYVTWSSPFVLDLDMILRDSTVDVHE